MTSLALPMIALLLSGQAEAWRELPPIPESEGLAGTFAGVCDGRLLLAGGANFPDRKPWDGGKKCFHDDVFLLDQPNGRWRLGGKLPRPLAYGVSITHRDGVVCVGGCDAERHYAESFAIRATGAGLAVTRLPALPKSLAYACGALVGDTIYVAGGQESPDSAASSSVYSLDLSTKGSAWQHVEPIPGSPRILAIASAFHGSFWLLGGADLVKANGKKSVRRYLSDAYCFDPQAGWKRVADLPHPVAAAPSPAPFDDTGIYVLGGDDGAQAAALPEKHRGFPTRVLKFDAVTGTWHEAGRIPAARVTTPAVPWHDTWVIPSGEVRPGVRSPQVWAFQPARTK